MSFLVADQVEIATDNLQISAISYGTRCSVQCSNNGVSISTNYGDIKLGNPSGQTIAQNAMLVQGNLEVEGYAYFGLLETNWKICTDMIERNVSGGITTANAINVGAEDWNATASGYVYCGKVVESSDSRLKENVDNMDHDRCLAFIMSLRPVSFRFIYSPEVTEYGFIAQEVRQSEADSGMEDGIVVETGKRYEGHENTLSMKYDNLLAPIVKVIQSQQAEIDKLKEAFGIGQAG